MTLFKSILTAILLIAATNSFAQEEMTYDQYLVELKKEQDREGTAKQQIDQLEKDIADLQGQLTNSKSQIESLWQEMLDFVGITQEEFDTFAQKIDDLTMQIQSFESEYSEMLAEWSKQLDIADKEVESIKANKIAIFPRLDGKITGLEDALLASKEARAAMRGNTYTVRLIPERRDCLWRIAENDEIYGDAFKWPQIYSANKDQIKDPDLIFPGQELVIPQ
ncbi:MAG: LysM peptidoglycan-binding domain-containing protein [Fibrobacterales bacterium]